MTGFDRVRDSFFDERARAGPTSPSCHFAFVR